MRTNKPAPLLTAALAGALISGILGGWTSMAIGLVTLPLVVLGVKWLRARRSSH